MSETTGRIFDIKEFAVHDGPGAGITLFLKGCPLRCVWCHNPEGQRYERELMCKSALCAHCGACEKNRQSESYLAWGRDVAACPRGLLSVCGTDLTPEQVLSRVLPLKPILEMTEGGVTFSGGEPLMQADFLCATASLLRSHGISTALETCGYASEETFLRVLSCVDYVMMDLKLMDEAAHVRYTGVSNAPILQNATHLMASGVPFIFRTPLIPAITDTEENVSAIAAFVGDAPWERLPYNSLAGAKYPMLGREYPYDKQFSKQDKGEKT